MAGPHTETLGTRAGRFLARHRRWVLVVWGVVLVAAAAAAPGFQRSLGAAEYSVDGSDSARADVWIQTYLKTGEQDVIVFHSDHLTFGDRAFRRAVDSTLDRVRTHHYVAEIIAPGGPGGAGQVSHDEHTAYAVIGIPGDKTLVSARIATLKTQISHAVAHTGVSASLTGTTPVGNALTTVENGSLRTAEVIGIPIALVILLVALGSVVSALMPLVVAGLGVLGTYGLLSVAARFTSFSTFAPEVASMVGLGVGIDYSMFLVSRFREEFTRSGDSEIAAGTALATAGRTVAASGIVVMLSLGSLAFVRSHIFREVALAAACAVASAMAVALTLLPAVLAMAGRRLRLGSLPRSLQPPEVAGRPSESGFWGRWARTVMRRPVVAAVAVGVVVLVMASPLLGMRLGIDYGLDAIAHTPAGQGLRKLSAAFSDGTVSPTQVVLVNPDGPFDDADLAAVARLTRKLKGDPAVASVTSVTSIPALAPGGSAPTVSSLNRLRSNETVGAMLAPIWAEDGRATVIQVAPSVPVDDPAAAALVRRIRSDQAPRAIRGTHLEAAVGGIGALNVDMSHEVSRRLRLVVGLVIALSFCYLLVVFRSLVLPAKAIVVNLLATGAAFGMLVLVFQHGIGQGVLGFTSPGYLQVYLPLIVFVLLFGLSMDYEVFLVSRMQERWLVTGDNAGAVADGISHTARPISAAAGIMVAVFGAFLAAPVMELKQFGFGLAVAVAIDATLIRLILVPALMAIAGRWNWWLPWRLERRLPYLRVEPRTAAPVDGKHQSVARGAAEAADKKL